MECIRIILVLLAFLSSVPVYSGTYSLTKSENVEFVSDAKLVRLAAVKGIIPERLSKEYIEGVKKSKLDILNWIVADRKSKTELILDFIDHFDDEDITISNPSDYYVDQMNAVLYRAIQGNKIDVRKSKNSLLEMFKQIAAMEGDFAIEEKSKVECLKDVLGDAGLKEYKASYPQKYKNLEDMDKQ